MDAKGISVTEIDSNSIQQDILSSFHHNQVIRKKWLYDCEWKTVDCFITRQWDNEKRKWIPQYWQEQIDRGGTVLTAYDKERIIGFVCLDGGIVEKAKKYANLTMLFVDDEYQGQGIGRQLFIEILKYAKKMAADKLYISAIPSIDTIAFYLKLGCKDAKEIIPEYIDSMEDRPLEYVL